MTSMIKTLSGSRLSSSSACTTTTDKAKTGRKSSSSKDAAPITDFISSTRKKTSKAKKKDDGLSSYSDHPPRSSTAVMASRPNNAFTRSSSMRSIRKSFNDLLRAQEQENDKGDYSVKVFTGRMMLKKNAWKDQASEGLPLPPTLTPSSSHTSLHRTSSASSSSRKSGKTRSSKRPSSSSSLSPKRLNHNDVDKIYQLVTSMKEQPNGQQLLHDFVKKQARTASTSNATSVIESSESSHHDDDDGPPLESIQVPIVR